MVDASSEEEFKTDLFPFVERRPFNVWFGKYIDSLALDPAIPALFGHIATWGVRKADRFDVVHDDSKPILASQATFESMLALSGEESNLIGYDRRKMRFPLRALTLTQASSVAHPQLQVADLCAGVINHYNRCWMAGEFDKLANATRNLRRLEWVFDGVVPSADVTPESLGTDEAGGTNPVDAMAEYLHGRRRGR